MAETKQRDEWARTSSLMALFANANRDAKKHRAFRPTDFDPFSQTQAPKQKVDVSILKDIFIDGKQSHQRKEAHPCNTDTTPTSSPSS
jgi:hypothetical protein